MPIGAVGVTNQVNTTSGVAQGVIAADGVGGLGVVDQGGIPPTESYILTESSNPIITESSDYIITQ